MQLGERIRKLSAKQIMTILDGNLGGICLFRVEEKIQAIYINRGFYKMSGYTPEEYSRYENDVLQLVQPHDAMKIMQFARSAVHNMTSFETSFRVRADGGVKWHHVQGIPIREDGSQETIILGIIRDVSRMKETESLLDSVLSSSPGGIFRTKLEAGYELIYANEDFYRLRGYSPREVREKLFNKTEQFIFFQDRQRVWQSLQEAVQLKKQRMSLELRIQCKDGTIRWIMSSISFTYEFDGTVILTGVDNDITEKRHLEEELRLSEARLKIAFSQTNNILREYVFATKQLRQISFDEHGGYVEENVPEFFITSNLVHPVSQMDYLDIYRRLREGAEKSTAVIKAKNRWESAYSWYRISYTNVFGKDGKPLRAIGTIENINDAKEAIDKYADEEKYRAIITADALHTFHGDLILDKILRADGILCRQMGVNSKLSYAQFIRLYGEIIVQPEWREDFLLLASRKNLAKAYNDGNRNLNMEFQYRNIDGELLWCSVSIHLLKSAENGNIYAYFYVRNITEKKEYELALQDLIERDQLTYLYNTETFKGLSTSILVDTVAAESKKGFLFIGVMGLDEIATSYGHAYGQELLKSIAEKLVSACGGSDIIGRLPDNNFAIFIPEVYAEKAVLKQALNISSVVETLLESVQETRRLHCHIGIAFAPNHGNSFEDLLNKASLAANQVLHNANKRVLVYGENDDFGVQGVAIQGENLSDEIDDLLFVINLRTNNLLYANQHFLDTFKLQGVDYSGEKCYRLIRSLIMPCEECNKEQLRQDVFNHWEWTDERSGRHYLVKSKMVSWGGLPARLVIAVDITEKENISVRLQQKLKIADSLTACIRKVARTHLMEESMEAFSEALLEYYDAEQCYIVEAVGVEKRFHIIHEGKKRREGNSVRIPWPEIGFEQTLLLQAILAKGEPFVFTGAGQFAKSYPHDYECFRKYGMESACFVSFDISEKNKGFMCVINFHKAVSNLELITSLGYFVAATINHHREQ